MIIGERSWSRIFDEERTFAEVVRGLLRSGAVSVLGVTGQAGAGKTNYLTPLVLQIAQDAGFAVADLPLDAFFKLSSAQRKRWLQEGERISSAEGAQRRNQLLWWDFVQAQGAVATLKRGDQIHLTHVYNRRNRGELTGEILIEPPAAGMLVALDGVAICHLEGLDALMYVHAAAEVRFGHLVKRDLHRNGEEARQRFELTEAFERDYFPRYWERIQLHVDNNVDRPRMLPPMHHAVVFGASSVSLT